MEDDLNGKLPQLNITSLEDDLNGIRPQCKTTSINNGLNSMEENLDGRRLDDYV